MDQIGLIAGNGRFPIIFAREAKLHGVRVTAVGHKGETVPELERDVDSLTWIRVGQLGKMIAVFRRAGIRRAVMVGGLDKVRSLRSLRPDWRGWRFLARGVSMGDDGLLRALARELETEGIEVVPSTLFLDRLFAPAGRIAGPRPDSAVLSDITLGCKVLDTIGALDIGQCVIVEKGVVLAVEAVEGSDAAIVRGGKLGGGTAVVVKAAKGEQDLRFDVPAVGPSTLDTMLEAGVRTLALQAGSTIILDAEEFRARAERYGIGVVGCSLDGEVEDD